jgi:hypothetical protein
MMLGMAMMRVMRVILLMLNIQWNAGCHGQRAQQQKAWNELHFRRLGYVL